MKRIILLITLIFPLVFLNGCFCPLTSVNPLSDPHNAKYDKRIGGAWQSVSTDGDLEFIHFGKDDEKKTQMVIIEHMRSGKIDFSTLTVFPTIINGKGYLNIHVEELFEEFKEDLSGYVFMKYELLDKNTLTLSFLEEKPIIEAIKSGTLEGEITYEKKDIKKGDEGDSSKQGKKTTIKCVTLSDRSDNILKYIQSNDPDKLFPKPIELRRIK
ncbi:hypothetical protein ACFL03_12810 [Thermodesulfobacteriota bacterium]